MNTVNKILIILISLFKGFYNRFFFSKTNNINKEVIVVFSGIIGDVVCFLDSMKRYIEVFPANKGYKVTFIFKPVVIKFIYACGIEINADIVELDLSRYCSDYKYFNESNKLILLKKYDYVIAPQKSISAAIVSMNIKGTHKYTLDYPIKIQSILKSVIYSLAYNNRIQVSENCTIIKAMTEVINYFSEEHILAHMPQISIKTNEKTINTKEPYCVIAPVSSRYEKEWELSNYANIINKLVDKGYFIYLCGTNVANDKLESLMSNVINRKKVINLLCKTGFKEWIELILNAKLLVGCDSASIHIAAATNTPSICILGGMDYNLIYPYQLDEIFEGQYIPDCVICEPKECFGCRRRSDKYGFGNIECINKIKLGKSIMCIEHITVDQVWNRVMKYI
ncbi:MULTISPECIES: ADP-heptose--LPS heptosyltransferase [unclassified Clostridium]|uniref:ADP-heptose--LPS heptosyltransferase n=1 Tax=unclassified Clostridium TaxID=2614128 RepID=UPI0002978B01|nr:MULTISPECIES: ADP-heptose--LPS heptosyltransferase [unclassified Clostridium]EKQ56972.1 MAG: ADP-heptose:LPS heptosyltransferase [Clostridium sp. Maddingley MBC34-26]